MQKYLKKKALAEERILLLIWKELTFANYIFFFPVFSIKMCEFH
jgi:hypothetical protein